MSSKSKFKEKILSLYDNVFLRETERTNFWNELFLIRPKGDYLSSLISKLNDPCPLRRLVEECVTICEHGSAIQCANSLQTQAIIVLSLAEKFSPDHCYEYLDYMFGYDEADLAIDRFCSTILEVLLTASAPILRSLATSLLLACLTTRDRMEKNILGQRMLLCGAVGEKVFQMFESVLSDERLGTLAMASTVCLLQMKKKNNPLLQRLSCLDSALALDGLGYVIELELTKVIEEALSSPEEISGYFSWGEPVMIKVKVASSALITLLTILRVNRNFIPVLTQWRARHESAGSPPLATFLEYLSLVQQNMKDKRRKAATRIAFSILTLVAEDHFANCFLHDDSVKFRLRLHQAPARHRTAPPSGEKASTFSAWILQICSEFIVSHLMKDFPLEIHQLAIGIVHRLLIYQKRARCRLNGFNWRPIWESLILLLKFICSNTSSLHCRHHEMALHQLIKSTLIVLNIFITCGDVVLVSTEEYDQLYYEIIRVKSIFDKVDAYATQCPLDSASSASLNNLLYNIRSIQEHFEPILKQSSTPQQVKALIQNNYTSLNLRMIDGLDNYERINSEKVADDLVDDLVKSSRKILLLDPVDYRELIR